MHAQHSTSRSIWIADADRAGPVPVRPARRADPIDEDLRERRATVDELLAELHIGAVLVTGHARQRAEPVRPFPSRRRPGHPGMITRVTTWRLVGLLGGVALVATSSTVIAGRRRRHQQAVIGVAVLSWAVGVWAALPA